MRWECFRRLNTVSHSAANGDLPDVRLDSVSLEPDDDFYATLAKSIRAYEATVQGMSEEMLAVRESFGTQLAANAARSPPSTGHIRGN